MAKETRYTTGRERSIELKVGETRDEKLYFVIVQRDNRELESFVELAIPVSVEFMWDTVVDLMFELKENKDISSFPLSLQRRFAESDGVIEARKIWMDKHRKTEEKHQKV